MSIYKDPNYDKPRNKSLGQALAFVARRNMSAADYELMFGTPAPAWMGATAEELAFFADCIERIANEHKVILAMDYSHYGMSVEAITQAALQKQIFAYRPGDYLPTAMQFATVVETYQRMEIADYHGIYYVAVGSLVYGLDVDNKQFTASTLYPHRVLCRFATVAKAKEAIDEVNA